MRAFVTFSSLLGFSWNVLVPSLVAWHFSSYMNVGVSPLYRLPYHLIKAGFLKSPGWERQLEKKLWQFKMREVMNFLLLQKCSSAIENYVILQYINFPSFSVKSHSQHITVTLRKTLSSCLLKDISKNRILPKKAKSCFQMCAASIIIPLVD